MNKTLRTRFEALSPEVSAYVATLLLKKKPELDVGAPLADAIEKVGLNPTDVILALASDSTPEGVIALETLSGKAIDKVGKADPDLPPDVGDAKPARQPRAPRSPGAPRQPRAPRVGKTDPRIISFVMPNPKKPGSLSADRYEHYRVGARVDECVTKGKLYSHDLTWDLARGHVQIVSAEEWAAMQAPVPESAEA
jgi:hypothetical protein